MSPGSSRPDNSTIVPCVIAPAGNMTQTARGLSSRRTNSARSWLPRAPPPPRPRARPLAGERPDRLVAFGVDDAAMAGAHQPPHDIAAHPAEPDHPELHWNTPL